MEKLALAGKKEARKLRVIQGGLSLKQPKDYHDHIRWKRIGLFLLVAVPFMVVIKLLT